MRGFLTKIKYKFVLLVVMSLTFWTVSRLVFYSGAPPPFSKNTQKIKMGINIPGEFNNSGAESIIKSTPAVRPAKKDKQGDPTEIKSNQKCTIPTLNPFHPDIVKFTRDEPSSKICSYRWYSEVDDKGRLYIKQDMTSHVKKAQFAYIVRINKNKQKTTELQTFFEESKKQGIVSSFGNPFSFPLPTYSTVCLLNGRMLLNFSHVNAMLYRLGR